MTFIEPFLVNEDWFVKLVSQTEWSSELLLYSFHILLCCRMPLVLGEAIQQGQQTREILTIII